MSIKQSIGVIGLGEIGGGIAATLARRGHTVWGYDISAEACCKARENGVREASSLGDMLANCDIIATSLSSLAAIEETYFGAGGLSSSNKPDLLTIECSTVAPDFARRITKAIYETGKTAIEASVVGVGMDAQAGNLFFVVSGAPQAVARASGFLDHAGRGHVHVGPSGSASVIKLLNNAIGAVTLCGVAEALALVRDLGIDPAAFVEAVREGRGDGYSRVFERHAPYMAKWRESTRHPNPIALKDAEAVASLIDGRAANFGQLASMVSTYKSLMPRTTLPAAETLVRYMDGLQTKCKIDLP